MDNDTTIHNNSNESTPINSFMNTIFDILNHVNNVMNNITALDPQMSSSENDGDQMNNNTTNAFVDTLSSMANTMNSMAYNNTVGTSNNYNMTNDSFETSIDVDSLNSSSSSTDEDSLSAIITISMDGGSDFIGGYLYENKNNNNNKNSTDCIDCDDEGESTSSFYVAENILIRFVIGVAILIVIILIVYIASILFQRFCGSCCCSCYDAVEINRPHTTTDEEEQQRNNNQKYSIVSRKAGLWGLQDEERKLILQHLFPRTEYSNSSSSKCQCKVKKQRQQQEQHAADKDGKTGNNKNIKEVQIILMEEGSFGDDGKSSSMMTEDVTTNIEVQEIANEDDKSSSPPSPSSPCGNAGTCPICLLEFVEGEHILVGALCEHIYHYDCAMEWLNTQGNDLCPYCRGEMMTPLAMRKAAKEVLSEDRFQQVIKQKQKQQHKQQEQHRQLQRIQQQQQVLQAQEPSQPSSSRIPPTIQPSLSSSSSSSQSSQSAQPRTIMTAITTSTSATDDMTEVEERESEQK